MKNVKIVYLDKKNYIDTLKSFLLSISNSKLVKIFNSALDKFKNKFLKTHLSKINWRNELGEKFLNLKLPNFYSNT